MSSILEQDPSRMSLGTKILPEMSLTKAIWAKPLKTKRPVDPADPENRKLDAERRRVAAGGRNATWISEAAAPASTTGPIASLTGLKK